MKRTNDIISFTEYEKDQWHYFRLAEHEKDYSNVVVLYSWFVIGQCCNFQGINSTVEIS
jgi:hypothetical protein